MSKKSFWFSLLVSMILLAVAFPLLFVNGKVSADSDLPDVPDVVLSEDGVLSWGTVLRAYSSTVEISSDGYSIPVSTKTTLDIKAEIGKSGRKSGSYAISVQLFDSSNKPVTNKWSGTYEYVSLGRMNIPTNFVFDEAKKKATWQYEGADQDTFYDVSVKSTMNGNSEYRTITCKTPELPLYSFLKMADGEVEYTLSLTARKAGYENSSYTGYAKLTLKYTWNQGPVKNVKVDEKGVLHWSAFEGANTYVIIWTYGDAGSGRQCILVPNATEYDIEKDVIDNKLTGEKINVEIIAAFCSESVNMGQTNLLSESTKISYQSTTVVYPLWFYNIPVTSRNKDDILEDGGSCKYDPKTKTLTFADLDYTNMRNNDYDVFATTEDLTIAGTACINCHGRFLNVDKKLTFAPGSDITVFSSNFQPVVLAESIVINGKNLTIRVLTSCWEIMSSYGDITFGSQMQSFVATAFEDIVRDTAVKSDNGKIVLNGNTIIGPEGGVLSPDGHMICKKDGASATTVIIRSSTYTVPADAIAIDEKHFPDPTFRQYILEVEMDVNLDQYLDKKELGGVIDMDLGNFDGNMEDITSLKGIEYFTSLETLFYAGTKLTSIDISNNTKLRNLILAAPSMDKLDISKCPLLKKAYTKGERTDGRILGYEGYFCTLTEGSVFMQLAVSEEIKVIVDVPITDKTVEINKSFQYTVFGVSGTSIKWSVGNTSVATVSTNGTVTGKSIGNTYLYAVLPDGTTIKCLIRVVYPTLKINYTEKTLHINQTFQFGVSGAAGQKITWSIGNSSVATLDASGKVTGKRAANTYLYAKSADGRVAKCLVKVIDPGTLGINYTEKTVYLGQSFTFTAKNAGILTPTWSVGNTLVAKVDSNGKVTSVSVGNTYLYAKTADGRSARCLVKVVDPGPLNIRYTEKTIKVGASFQFTAKNPAGQTVSWRVGNTSVATVDANGKVTGKKAANTWLYASTPDGREVRCLLKIVA